MLGVLKLPNREMATSGDAVCERLVQHWRKNFLWQPSDETAPCELMSDVPLIPDIPPPTKATVAHVVATAKNRAPGWDGLPSEGLAGVGSACYRHDLEHHCVVDGRKWDAGLLALCGEWFSRLRNFSLETPMSFVHGKQSGDINFKTMVTTRCAERWGSHWIESPRDWDTQIDLVVAVRSLWAQVLV